MPKTSDPTTETVRPHGKAAATTKDVPSLNEALADLEEELELLKAAAAQVEESATAARSATEAAGAVTGVAVRLTGAVEEFVQRVDTVDFPSRFDKMEGEIARALKLIKAAEGGRRADANAIRSEIASVQKETVGMKGDLHTVKLFSTAIISALALICLLVLFS